MLTPKVPYQITRQQVYNKICKDNFKVIKIYGLAPTNPYTYKFQARKVNLKPKTNNMTFVVLMYLVVYNLKS